MPSLRDVLRPPLLLLAFLWVVLEETIWGWARAIGGLLARLPVFAALERFILRLDPWVVLLFFLVPLAALIPVKIGAVWLIGTGHPLGGLALLLAAKSIGTAFSARLYVAAEPKLMEIPLFVRLRGIVLALVARAHAFLDSSPAWQAALRAVRRAKAAVKGAAMRARTMLLGASPSLLDRVRAVRSHWRHRA